MPEPGLLQLPGLRRRLAHDVPRGRDGDGQDGAAGHVHQLRGGRLQRAAPRAGAHRGGLCGQAGRHRVQHGLWHQLLGHPVPHGQGLPHHQRQPEPHVHRQRRAQQRRHHPRVQARRLRRSGVAAAQERGGGPGAHAPAVAQDPDHGGGHLQHGGRDRGPGGRRVHRQAVQGVRVPGRGAQHRRHGQDGPWHLRALQRVRTRPRVCARRQQSIRACRCAALSRAQPPITRTCALLALPAGAATRRTWTS